MVNTVPADEANRRQVVRSSSHYETAGARVSGDARSDVIVRGVWPVMLTPFRKDGAIDWPALDALVDWYLDVGVSRLFASCLSSEMIRCYHRLITFYPVRIWADVYTCVTEYRKLQRPSHDKKYRFPRSLAGNVDRLLGRCRSQPDFRAEAGCKRK